MDKEIKFSFLSLVGPEHYPKLSYMNQTEENNLAKSEVSYFDDINMLLAGVAGMSFSYSLILHTSKARFV